MPEPIGFFKNEHADGRTSALPTQIALSSKELQTIHKFRKSLSSNTRSVYAYKYGKDDWMMIHRSPNNNIWLVIEDKQRKYTCSAMVDLASGKLSILNGVDYTGLDRREDAERTATRARLYVQEAGRSRSRAEKEAYRVWSYLQKFPYRYSENQHSPQEIRDRKVKDCDDVVVYAWDHLTRAGIKAEGIGLILPKKLMAEVSIPRHALCVYKDGNTWRWLDDSTFGRDTAPTYETLLTKIFNEKTKYIVIRMKETWVKGLEDKRVDDQSYWEWSK